MTADELVEEQLDEIVQLNKMIELLQSQMLKWIPVGERLPAEPDDVLVSGDTGISVGYCVVIGSVKRWFGNSNITHWQPLPEKPRPALNERPSPPQPAPDLPMSERPGLRPVAVWRGEKVEPGLDEVQKR